MFTNIYHSVVAQRIPYCRKAMNLRAQNQWMTLNALAQNKQKLQYQELNALKSNR
jgi:hypothetical protein